MRLKMFLLSIVTTVLLTMTSTGQEVIKIWPSQAPGTEDWQGKEMEFKIPRGELG